MISRRKFLAGSIAAAVTPMVAPALAEFEMPPGYMAIDFSKLDPAQQIMARFYQWIIEYDGTVKVSIQNAPHDFTAGVHA